MENKEKNCQNCKKSFNIESEDFKFYEKMKVPAPTWCPECRMIRRISFQNNWHIYWRNCDKCGEKTLSVCPPEQKIIIFCQQCWWKDDWDGTENAREYDPSRNFLEQMKELILSTPYSALTSLYTSNKNCEYANGVAWCKDCYLVFWADYCDNVYYSSLLNGLKSSLDCIRGYNSELSYESIGFSRCYNLFFSDECDDCVDVWFSRNCYGCTNCIGCVNLSGASNCIFNVKYSKEEYLEKIKELNFESWQNINNFKEKAYKFWQTLPYRAYHGHSLNKDVSGDYIYESKNVHEMYISNGAENCKWCQFITVKPARDCYDYSGWGNNVSLIYETNITGENSSNILFSNECWPDSLNIQYCIWNIAGKNNFGCVNLKRKQYCILNKEYSKEDFEKLRDYIIEDMKINPYVDNVGNKYFYGEYFPPEFSRFAYNKSNAMRFFPKTKDQVIKMGYMWSDIENLNSNFTIKGEDLPLTIKETSKSILNEIIECINCKKGFKITKGEYDLLLKMNLPIPHECPKCRENIRFSRLSPIKLYDRICAKCKKEIKTPYDSSGPEIIYCEDCYQKEVY